MHFASAADPKAVGGVGVVNPQGHIPEQFPEEPVAQLAGGDKFSLPAGKGAVVDREGHLQGGLGDLDKLRWLQGYPAAQMVSPMVIPSMPETQTISPTLASSQGTRLRPSIS